MKEQQENLETKVKALQEKITIAELENGNKTKQQAIADLESRVNDLEQKLKNAFEGPNSTEPEDKAKPEFEVHEPIEEVTAQNGETTVEEAEEETVEVTALEDSTSGKQESYAENLKTHDERKKRRFF